MDIGSVGLRSRKIWPEGEDSRAKDERRKELEKLRAEEGAIV